MEIASVVIVFLSILGMFALLLFHPEIKIGFYSMDSFFLGPLLGAVVILAAGLVDYGALGANFTSANGINPLEILVLFLSMSFLSIVLDEAGFFSFIAAKVAAKANNSQFLLFILLYLLTSVLTTFTSNDIVILTFTPFLIYFAKNAKINPTPYLVEEFVAANTWSLLFIIGNPTNIYLGQSFGLLFFDYFQHMWLSALLSGLFGLGGMLIIFWNSLQKQFHSETEAPKLHDPAMAYVSLALLIATVLVMALTDFMPGISMWLASLVGALLLLAVVGIHGLRRPKESSLLKNSVLRLPFSVIPFLLSMFVLVMSLKTTGVLGHVAAFLESANPYLGAGLSSFFAANFLNNIPMSVLYTEIFRTMGSFPIDDLYLAIISSNIGAFLTPVGALAGVMWVRILKDHNVGFGIHDYFRYLTPLSFLSLGGAFLGYWLVML